jgi:hypothetical protein
MSLYSNNWLVLITELECVYCAVRVVPLNIIQVKLSLYRIISVLGFFPKRRQRSVDM